jgi:hypothetical protein
MLEVILVIYQNKIKEIYLFLIKNKIKEFHTKI